MTGPRSQPIDGQAVAAGSVRAEAILEELPDAVVVLEDGAGAVAVNAAAERILGQPRTELLGRGCGEVLPLRSAQGESVCSASPLGQRLPLVKGAPEREYELTRPNGEYVPVSLKCAYVKDERQVVRRIVCTLRDARARQGMDMRTVELISTVSHEIRSPLTSIKGFTKTLLDRYERFDDDLKKEMLQAINTDADRVTRLLGELLDISRLEAGRLRLRLRRFDLAELIQTVATRMAPQSDAHELRLDVAAELPPVVADPDKIQQVLTNLIENALKYTEGGVVSVSAEGSGDWVVVAVADEGEGIAEMALGRLFRKFYRRDRAGSPTGTGLGLYICKGLIEAHGGEINVESNPGSGSTFRFRIPITARSHDID